MKISIRSSDRVFVTGRSGSGKSVLIKNLLIPQYVNFVVYDYKHEIDLPDCDFFYSIDDFRRRPNLQRIVYRPATGKDEEFNELCRQVYYRGNNTLILDEIAFHCSGGRIQPYHDLIMRLGRSKGVGIVNCTQRPRGTHNNIISQCEHFFIFDLIQDTDRKKLAEFCGDTVLQRVKNYSFYYHSISCEAPVLCRPIRL